MNVKEGIRRLGLVAGFLGLGLGVLASSTDFRDITRGLAEHKEFESLVTSDAFNKQVREFPRPDEGVKVR